MQMRRVTYKLYPSKTQEQALERMHMLHRRLYNAALEERISAWRNARISINYSAQCRSITKIRLDDPDYREINAQSLQVTLKRLDEAFSHFFRRVKTGKTPGFPRFKSLHRFSGWGYKSHGDGFRFKPGAGWRHGHLRLSGIGWMQARGEARTPGEVKRCEITRKADGWFASIVVACEPHRELDEDAHEAAGFDWGVESYATVARDLDDVEVIENARFWNAEAEALKASQRDLSKALRGKRSKRAQKRKRLLAKRHRKLANRRKDHGHQSSARMVRRHRLLATEELAIANMTRSARGSQEKPGRNVAQKAGLNRSILDTAPGGLLKMLAYKAEEAGCELVMLPTRKLKPSQRDPLDWSVSKKRLDQRTHQLPDGRTIGRDHAAALVMQRAALNAKGREPAWAPR
jgi:putative transposase